MALPLSQVAQPGFTKRPAGGQGLTLDDQGRVIPPTVHLEPYSAACTAATAVAGTATDITGATVTLAKPGVYFIAATFDFSVTGLTGLGIGELDVGGTTQTAAAIMDQTNTRITVSQMWIVTVSAGTVAKLTGRKTSGGTLTVNQDHTTIHAFPIA